MPGHTEFHRRRNRRNRNNMGRNMESRNMRSMRTSSGYRRGGNIKRMPHGGPHARANEFRNRRTGQVVPTGAAYHMHPEKGPMEGAVHNPNIPGGTAGHDFYDRISNSNGRNMRRGGRTRLARKMPHGGPHGTNGGLFCPNGNYGFNEFGETVCV
mgnify:FL=1